ncbi:hypothetical protein [Streptomyces sp. SAT1]|uniref:hypothetical protein n=1 Tax=Streptomyces sp. SAT1 TaxID=1849967 RepID=UPI00156EB986|nr:hypothetical protein [Streptomyces sp. SAT1]
MLFLEDGAVVEDGSVDALPASGGRFHDVRRHQKRSASWRPRAAQTAGGPGAP